MTLFKDVVRDINRKGFILSELRQYVDTTDEDKIKWMCVVKKMDGSLGAAPIGWGNTSIGAVRKAYKNARFYEKTTRDERLALRERELRIKAANKRKKK